MNILLLMLIVGSISLGVMGVIKEREEREEREIILRFIKEHNIAKDD